METPFSRIEREVFVRYLGAELPELHINTGKRRFTIPSGTYTVSKGSLMLPSASFVRSDSGLSLPVRIRFYYNKRGLFFLSRAVQSEEKTAVVIPEDIFKVVDEETAIAGDFSASVSFSVNKGRVEIPVRCVPELPLFKADTWYVPGRISGGAFFDSLQKNCGVRKVEVPPVFARFLAAKGKLFDVTDDSQTAQKLPFDAFVSGRESDLPPSVLQSLKNQADTGFYASIDGISENSVLVPAENVNLFCEMVPVCVYLETISATESAIQGKANPLTLAYISDKQLILGGSHNTFPFKTASTFDFYARFGIRSVNIHCVVERIIPGKGRSCAVCGFTQIKPEDTRFLFERINKKRFM